MSIYVKPQYRRLGIGTKLYQEILPFIPAKNKKCYFRDGIKGAEVFYKKISAPYNLDQKYGQHKPIKLYPIEHHYKVVID